MLSKSAALRYAAGALFCAPLLLTSAQAADAKAYPEKPVKIIVTYPPGGSTDTITRLLGHALSEKWGQPVVVENKGGASGMIGTTAAARSTPDGYTLVMNGSGPALIDAIAGVCHVLFDSALSAGPHVSSGKLKLIAVGTENRLGAWPSTPAIAETLPGFSAYSWTALLAPAGTPEHIVRKVNADTAQVLNEVSIIQKLEAQGAIPGKGSPEELAAFIRSEIDKWAKVIADGNIAVN